MEKEKRPKINKEVVVIVCAAALLFLAAGLVLGLWSAREMKEVVADQFNEQQLVVARHVSSLIERQVSFLKKELLLLSRQAGGGKFGPETYQEKIQNAFHRILESGVWKIEIIDREEKRTFLFMPYRHWIEKQSPSERLDDLSSFDARNDEDVWVSPTQIKSHGASLLLGRPIPGAPQKLLIFELNLSWFLNPFLKDIRSGKTGYAWIIDERGNFIYHPNAEFVGRDAIEVREEKYPGVPLGMIAYIQKEKMLQGEAGTGWFYSGWNRGRTGRIEKLIAYSPVQIRQYPARGWSVAVTAPFSEIDESVHRAYLRQFFLQGLILMVILSGAAAVLFFEMKWSRTLEGRVKQRTEELKRSEEKYRSLVESAEDFIYTVDREGIFQSMNSFTAGFFGGRAEEFTGKGLSSLFPEKVAEKQSELVKLVYGSGKSVRDEFEIVIGDHAIWISANFMPLKNEEGAVASVLCIARDITESKNLERQLINAEKLASMGTIAAGVAHEVNNPLGVMLGFCDLLLRKVDKQSQEYEDLKTIERQGLHCKQVVENLLSFARVGQGGAEYADLNQCIREIIKVVKHTLEMNDIDLHLFLAESLPLVKGDPQQLQQVFLNLINNAVAAMPAGGALHVRTFQDRPGRKAVVQFQDNGIGVKAEDLEHIYEPFFTTKPEGEGTGLGLFVSYGIITKFGGSIDCASQPSSPAHRPKGTTFTIKLLTQV